MAVKLVPRAQVVAEEARRPGPVNALAFKRSEVSIQARRSDSELQNTENPKRKTGRHKRRVRSPVRSSVSPALTDEDTESSSPIRRYAGRRALRRPGAHLGRKREGRRPPRVSRRVRQLQAQHEDELGQLRRKRTQKKIEMEKERIEKMEREEREEREEVQKSQDFSVQEALPSPHQGERAPRVQSDPEKQRGPPPRPRPRPSKAKHVAKQQPVGEVPMAREDKAPDAPLQEDKPPTRAAPALALRRWRQARKRQNLLRQMTAMRGEMKFERRQLLSALQKPFNILSLEAEVHQQNRELKVRFQKFYREMSSQRQERQKSRTVLKALAAEHTELQRAFVRLMNECGFARPSALRASSPKEAGTHDDQNDQNGQNDEEDDDVIVEGDIEEDQVQEQCELDREKLKKEMQREALRAELLLRALDAEGSV